MSDLKSDNIRREAQNDVAGLRSKISSLTEDQVDLILSGARSHYAWKDTRVYRSLLC